MNLKKHMKCEIVDDISGEIICGCGCGYVIQEKMSTRSMQEDYRNDSKYKNLRVGMPSTNMLHDHGLSTIIGKSNSDFKRSQISTKNKQTFYKLREIDEWARVPQNEPQQRRMLRGLQQLQRVCDVMNLNNNVKEQTAVFYRKAVLSGLSDGRPIDHFVVSCCYIICKQLNVPITLHDFSDKLQLKTTLLFDYHYILLTKTDLVSNATSPTSLFLTQFANKLSIKNNVIVLAIKIIDCASKKGITGGKSPKAVCGAALYLACKEFYGKVTPKGYDRRRFLQSDVADVADVTDVTIRNIVRVISDAAIEAGLIKS